MFGYFRRRRWEPRIAAAVEEHYRFELAHIDHLTEQLKECPLTEMHRTVKLPEGEKLIRKPGEYDQDQRVERIAGELARAYGSTPRSIREMVKKALR